MSITWVAATPPTSAQVGAIATTPLPRESASNATQSGYRSNWSAGMDGWVGVSQWKTIPGMLISDGSSRQSAGSAAQGSDSVQPSYPACYIDIQLRTQAVGQGQDRHGYALGFAQGTGAFVGRFFPYSSFTIVRQTSFSPASDWHNYRAEVEENQLTLKIDGSTVLQATDNNYLDAGQVGLGNGNCQVQISSFAVAPL